MHIRPAVTLAFVCALLHPAVSNGSPETFRRGFGNLLQGAFDAACSPVTAGMAVRRNWDYVGDNDVERAFYPVFGYPAALLLNMGSGAMRTVMGAVELASGLFLFPFADTDLPEKANPFTEGEALVEADNPLAENPPWLKWVLPATPFTADVKFGILPPWGLYERPGASSR